MNNLSVALHTSFIGSLMQEIFISEFARICNVDTRTVNKWVADRIVTPIRTIPPGFRLFDKADAVKLAKKIPKERKRGLPIFLPSSKKRKMK